MADVCASVQFTIVSILMEKLQAAILQTGITEIALAGGVSANSSLRETLLALGVQNNWKIHIPWIEYCTDNAGMIAVYGYYKYLNNDFCGQEITPLARFPF